MHGFQTFISRQSFKIEIGAPTQKEAAVPVSNVQNAAPVYLVDSDGYPYSAAATGSGTVATLEVPATGTPTVTAVAMSTTSAPLCASSTTRRGVFIYNAASTVLYVIFGTTASSSLYTSQLTAGQLLYVDRTTYNGAIAGILGSGTANAMVTVTF